jgi:hypothetical protein
MSALRFARTTQGVTQAVGVSSPEISAVAPEGVVAMEIFSVVPRVTDAQPTHGNAIAAAKSSLIIRFFLSLSSQPSNNLKVKASRSPRKRCRSALTSKSTPHGGKATPQVSTARVSRHFSNPAVA